jgi:hypothetical protein
MCKFTVVLLYPEYMTDGRVETYLAHVEAPDVEEAILLARTQVEADEIGDAEPGSSPAEILEDYKVLAVFDGHLVDHKDQGWRNANTY